MTAQMRSPSGQGKPEGQQNHREDNGSGAEYTASAWPIDNVLSRLEGVRYIRDHKWLARCPVCQEERPTLLITETNHQSDALFCFGGCRDEEIFSAILASDVTTMEVLQGVVYG